MSSDPNLPFISRNSFPRRFLVSRPQPWWPGCSAGDFSHIKHTAWPAQRDACAFPHVISGPCWAAGKSGSPETRLPFGATKSKSATSHKETAAGCEFCYEFSRVFPRGWSEVGVFPKNGLSRQNQGRESESSKFWVKPFWQKLLNESCVIFQTKNLRPGVHGPCSRIPSLWSGAIFFTMQHGLQGTAHGRIAFPVHTAPVERHRSRVAKYVAMRISPWEITYIIYYTLRIQMIHKYLCSQM